ncbi:MAG: phosphotransferase [Chloroflexi bacterium]|nr:phosphotransferase [Chloroflexota bacterium]
MLQRFWHLYSGEVRIEAERRFGLTGVPWEPMTGSHSYVYDYHRGGHAVLPVVLKVTHTLHRTANEISGEQDFLDYLAVHGVTVSRPVLSASENYVEIIPAEEGEFLAWAFEKAPGALVEWTQWTPEIFKKWGAVLGKMHRLSKAYKPSKEEWRRPHWHEDEYWDFSVATPGVEPSLLSKRQQHRDWLMSLPTDADAFGLVHTDLHQWNLFWDGADVWPIDFDNLQFDWFAMDFAAIIQNVVICQAHNHSLGQHEYWSGGTSMDSQTFLDYFMQAFMAGYRTENTLAPDWIQKIPGMLNRRHLSFYFDAASDDGFRAKSPDAQASDFPWRTLDQLRSEVEHDFWSQFDFGGYSW